MNTVVMEFFTVGVLATLFIFFGKVISNKYSIPIVSKYFNTL